MMLSVDNLSTHVSLAIVTPDNMHMIVSDVSFLVDLLLVVLLGGLGVGLGLTLTIT
jgi:hypothetical protein